MISKSDPSGTIIPTGIDKTRISVCVFNNLAPGYPGTLRKLRFNGAQVGLFQPFAIWTNSLRALLNVKELILIPHFRIK
ncbi:hypothetical protein BN2127_JRS10_05042 [Bacillus subtilis]|nr:hypothetical protein BN2127_JRS10_05042 [Bacillus subtilis]